MSAEASALRDELALEREAQDAAARERATDPRRSIILQAPAGSGKTTVLTHRLLRLLAEVDEPEEILAVTFTRKAAAEMRARVTGALAGRIDDRSAAAQKLHALAAAARARAASRGWNLAAQPGRLRIMTIDALSRSLAAQLPASARATVGLMVAESTSTLHRRAARRSLLDAEQAPEYQPDLERLLERLDYNARRAESLIAGLLAVRGHWLRLILRDTPEELPRRVVASLRSIVTDRLRAAEALFTPELVSRGLRLLGETVEGRSQASIAIWRRLGALALTGRREWRRSLSARDGFPASAAARKMQALDWIRDASRIDGAREMLVELASLPDPVLDAADEAALGSLGRLLRLAASELELVFAESARVDYPYIEAAARRALAEEGEPTDLTLRLGQRLRHILVDEFQDTSSAQYELLRMLTAGWQPGDGRSLFLVGDPMQSIYLFREAEVGLFLQACARGIGDLPLEPLVLTRNFRAGRELVDWLNDVFPAVFPRHDDVRSGAVRYVPSVAGHAERQASVTLHHVPAGGVLDEAKRVADIVVRARGESPACSIAVLVAARPHAESIATALHEAHVPIAGIDLLPLAAVPVVRDLTALAQALEHLADRPAWLAVLRAPWCGLTLRELTALLDDSRGITVWEALNDGARVGRLDARARARIGRLRGVLADALASRQQLSMARLLERVWLEIGGPAACATQPELAHAERFFERLAAWSAEPDWTGAEVLPDRLRTLFASDAGTPADAVQIMTIHRAKGLEFDVVIVPGLGRPGGQDPEPLLRWLELPGAAGELDLLMAPITPRSAERAKPLNRYLRSLQARRALHERARLLYVAATRARHALHLMCELPPATAAGAPRPRAGTLLAALWPGIGEQLSPLPPQSPSEECAEQSSANATQDSARAAGNSASVAAPYRLAPEWQAPAIEYPAAEAPFAVRSELPAATEYHWATTAARASGRVVHEVLRSFAGDGRLPERPRMLEMRAAIARRLLQLGVAGDAIEPAQARVLEALLAFHDDAAGRWLFHGTHRASATPLELSGIVGGQLVDSVIDRAFVSEEGVRWLVDVKLGVHGVTGQEAFIASEVARHRPALLRAAQLAARLGPEPLRAALYFPLLRRLVDVELHDAP